MGRGSRDRAAEACAIQWGVVGRAQLKAIGFSADAIEHRLTSASSSSFIRAHLPWGGGPRTWEQRLMAAQIWAGHAVQFTPVGGRPMGARGIPTGTARANKASLPSPPLVGSIGND